MLLRVFFIIFAMFITPASAQQKHPIEGNWVTGEADSIINIYACSAVKICGSIVWLKVPILDDKPLWDGYNKNPQLQSRSLLGLDLFQNMLYYGNNTWKGVIYNPRKGTNYNVTITLSNDNLNIKGCVAYGMVCGNVNWNRYRG